MEFKIMVIKMLTEFRRAMYQQNKNFSSEKILKRNHSTREHNNGTEKRKSLEGFSSTLGQPEEK